MTAGRAKARVLPEPVKATPTMSRPDRMTGRPCSWMGVGRLMPLPSSHDSTAGGNFISAKLGTCGVALACLSTLWAGFNRQHHYTLGKNSAMC